MIKKHLANMITSIRLIGAVVLLFVPVTSPVFLIVYTICGLSDAVDGFVARKLNAVSDLGRKLDSVSDVSLYSVMLYKVWPLLTKTLNRKVLYMILGLLLFRAILYAIYWMMKHALLATHSIWNKLCSILLFLLPYALQFDFAPYYCYMVMGIGLLAELHELYWMVMENVHSEAEKQKAS